MTGVICPCCHRPMEAPRAPIEGLSAIPMEGRMRTIVEVLTRAYPRGMTAARLAEMVYADDIDGGPLDAAGVMRVYAHRLRKVLPRYGWTIPNGKVGRGSHGNYRLAPLEEA